MASYKAIWHQALTSSLFEGKPFKKGYTAVFSVSAPFSGSGIRIRMSNLFGKEAYKIGSLTLSYEGKIFAITRDGKKSFSIEEGEQIYSDEVKADIKEGSSLQFRLYYLNEIIDGNMIEEGCNWIKGDVTYGTYDFDRIRKPFLGKVLGSYNFVPCIDLIEVKTECDVNNIVAFGDSITALSRWTKPLNERLQETYGGRYVLLNSGISGNCLLYEPEGIFAPVFGQKGVTRFERDVLELRDVKAVILALGVNDVSYYNEKTKDIINKNNYVTAISDIVNRLHEKKIRVIMQVITPRLKVARTMGRYDMEMEKLRLQLNEWIRNTDIFDYVIDQEAIVRDEDENGYFFKEGLHQGDHLHPNTEGGKRMADAYDLKKLTGE